MKTLTVDRALNRYAVIITCVVIAAASFSCSRWLLGEANLNLFASSGAVISLFGLLLTIKHTTLFLRSMPRDRAWRLRCSGAGMFNTGSGETEAQLAEITGILRDELFGVALMFVGTAIWAYAPYLCRFFRCAAK